MHRPALGAIAIDRGHMARLVDAPVPRMSPPRAQGCGHLEGPLYPYDYALLQHVLMQAAQAREPVLVLHIDSPGGYVAGVYETRRAMRMAQDAGVYVVAYVSGMACSAAYWVAAMADEVVVSPSADVGGVGVVVTLWACGSDDCVEVVSTQTPAKRIDVDDPASMAAVQARVDMLAARMLDDIAGDRGVSVEALGAGATFGAADAVMRGLADRVATDADDWMFLGGSPPLGYQRRPRTVTLAAVTITETEALDMSEQTAAQAAQVEALAAEVERLKGVSAQLDELRGRAEKAERALVERDAATIVDTAIREARIPQASRAAWVERAVRMGLEDARAMLADIVPQAQVGAAVGHGGADDGAASPAARAASSLLAVAREELKRKMAAGAAGGVR